ncbi:AGE family epimerase/isomerase [Phaeobacter italicus]|uniref:AGE family epimerase/isomerase n=1 Tax=Phaeobacter italicus TaxID=481446 RepID=UPI001ADBDF06|nr:AGE family epimerase/isomerase [Phaeobacter italicus]MBO9443868.1 AGE family epimerase/isomerase [Phaeobacter italicus]
MTNNHLMPPGTPSEPKFWLDTPHHRNWLMEQALRQLEFFSTSCRQGPGFHILDHDGTPLPGQLQELHTTTRLVHSFALGHLSGFQGAERIIDHGMAYLNSHHRDRAHGGYLWALDGDQIKDDRKLAYGHVFVLLASASAKLAGHPEADRLMADVRAVLDRHFWDDDAGLFCDEWNRDWTPFSTYRGMNANMHGAEALLTAYEATGDEIYLNRAGRILAFFIGKIAPEENWRLPEHYTSDWQVDRGYAGYPMFRPAGTTPGHSFELGRLQLQHWDLSGRPDSDAPETARRLIEQALGDAWLPGGGFAYTLDFTGQVDNVSRFWWPVTEAIGAVAALIALDRSPADEIWYRKLWNYANDTHVDHIHGGWFPAVDETGQVVTSIFEGKPDIYHSLQACLFPMSGRLSRMMSL